ncbi:MAG: hypothetical protein JO033_18510 [Acidobacteriaceae bacterium]|nr:hypothetical protein [Acidobacteriaceae bacterium]
MGFPRVGEFFLQIDIAEVVIHEADEPDAVINLLDSDCLTGEAGTEINLLAIKTKPSAVGDDDGLIVKRVLWFTDTAVEPGARRINFGGAFHAERFMRALVIELLQEDVELGLLLQ